MHAARLAVLPLLLALATPAGAATAPHMPIANFNQLAQPLPLPYVATADAEAAVAAAKARAKAKGKLLLIDLGGNWCPDCRVLAGALDVPVLKAFVARHYELVMVDIGRRDRNMQIGKRYGAGDLAGVPAMLVIDPRTDRLAQWVPDR
jgi:hypothetical protein